MIEQFLVTAGAVAAVAVPIAALQARNTRLQIQNAIQGNAAELLRLINGSYVKREVFEERMRSVDWRLGHPIAEHRAQHMESD